MKKLLLPSLLLLAFLGPFAAFSQIPQMFLPSQVEIAKAPDWAQLMYSADPNVLEVDRLYGEWFRERPFEKSYHTQYYKRWRRALSDHIGMDGHAALPAEGEMRRMAAESAARRAGAARATGNGWSVLGPYQVRNNNGDFRANQSNVYCLDRCAADTLTMWAGTEPGEIYRSTDGGLSWASCSDNLNHGGGLRAIAADPSNPLVAYASSGSTIYKTTDGGLNWSLNSMPSNFNANEILVHPANPSLVFVAANAGLYRSTDAGANWTADFSERSYDLKMNTGNSAILYLVKNNPAQNLCEFFVSTNTGGTWTQVTNGWFTSTDPGRNDGGARLAVSQADPNRVYAYLIGEAKTGDAGYIGVFKSTDGGYTWTLPNGPPGGPYSAAHPNLAIGTTTWLYHQGFYNCALMASNSNPDELLIGGLNLYRSTDGGATFASVSGYVGGPLNMHVDNQDFRAFGGQYWISTDGGIYRSDDFFNTQPEVRMGGIHGSDYWGFSSGWNEDVVVGGLYHNGNLAWYEPYAAGDFLSLGGGEAPTGYVNAGDARRTFFSDIGGRYLPTAIGLGATGLPFGLFPNEYYFSAHSSEVEWHPNCYNVAFLGRDNELWKSTDGGASFGLLSSFGASGSQFVASFEISSSDPEVLYVTTRPSSGSQGLLWRSADGGQTWTQPSLPGTSNKRRMLVQVDPEDPQKLFLAYPDGGNGQKIYATSDGGLTWSNLTTAMLNGESVHSLVYVPGTANGLYFCTGNTVFYKDDNLADWEFFDTALPVEFDTDIARPFFRDGKLRIASYGKGIWEADLHTPQSRPIARPMANALTALCPTDSFHFECYSFLRHAGASWSWTFQNGNPAASTQRNPSVLFNGLGVHEVVLTVTDANGQSDSDTMYVEVAGIQATQLAEDFEGVFPAPEWSQFASGNLNWSQNSLAGGFGNSANSVRCDNYNVNGQGSYVDLHAPVNFGQSSPGWLYWDVAYAQYGGQYTDTLEVLVSEDCGLSWTSLYREGGQSLATSPNQTTEFIPNAAQWRRDSVDLGPYQGKEQVIVAFRNQGNWGNVVYLDNINVDGAPLVGLEQAPVAASASIYPSPAVSGTPLRFQSSVPGEYSLKVYDLEGQVIWRGMLDSGADFQLDAASGIYLWEARGETLIQRGKLLLLQGR